jgi:MtfA peptidase
MGYIFNKFRRWNRQRMLQRHRIPLGVWQRVTRRIATLRGLDAVQMARLRELSSWFLQHKAINGVQGLHVTLPMRITVAAQACLLILNLDTEYFDNWQEVILYPGAFRVNHHQQDANGLIPDNASILSGESWLRGPVILSWQDVARDSYQIHEGHNVVVHEFAHKLDGLNGSANGLPPLRRSMKLQDWAAALETSFDALCQQVEAGDTPFINAYAATSPAEYFAVVSEYFFTAPEKLKACCPAVHQQLARFYQPAGMP